MTCVYVCWHVTDAVVVIAIGVVMYGVCVVYIHGVRCIVVVGCVRGC